MKAFWERWIKTRAGHFKAGYQEFSNPDQFEAQLEALLREWLDERVLKGRAVLWPISTKGSPFRGLAAFGAKHAPVFFGRGSEITRAVDVLKDAAERGSPFLLLIGSSGSGKSSLARAGLSPRLTTPGVVGAVDQWRVAVLRPGENNVEPTLVLSTHLFDGPKGIPPDEEGRPFALPELGKSSHKTPQHLAKALASGDPASVLWALDSIAEKAQQSEGYDRPVRADLLLIVDQLDELFAANVSEEEREAFAKALTALTATGRVWVIATLRTDLYERLQQSPILLALKQNGAAYDLAPPGAAELADIVRKPAEVAGLTYERCTETGQSLDEKLLEDAGRADMLPLLQFALQELFERREVKGADTLLTCAAYVEIGGLDGAIDRQAEQALADLGKVEEASLPRLLRQLAVAAREKGKGASLTIRSVPLSEAAPDEPAKRLVRALVNARILLSSGGTGGGSVRLAHERVLQSWSRASKIVRENANFFRIRDELEDQFERWWYNGCRRELMIPRGIPLFQANKLLHNFGLELDRRLGYFIVASKWRGRFLLINVIFWTSLISLPLGMLFIETVIKTFEISAEGFQVAGEAVGKSVLWTILLSWPFMRFVCNSISRDYLLRAVEDRDPYIPVARRRIRTVNIAIIVPALLFYTIFIMELTTKSAGLLKLLMMLSLVLLPILFLLRSYYGFKLRRRLHSRKSKPDERHKIKHQDGRFAPAARTVSAEATSQT